MGRKDYQADLRAAMAAEMPSNISELTPGDDDGSFNFTYLVPNSEPVALSVLVPELSEYPKEHSYMIFTTSENVPEQIQTAIQDLTLHGPIPSMLEALSTRLHSSDTAMTDGSDLEFDLEAQSDEEDDWLSEPELEKSDTRISSGYQATSTSSSYGDHRSRLRSDCLLLKKAGFRVAATGNERYLMVSVRIVHLKISEDTLRAWNLTNEEYLMLVINYRRGYLPLEQIGVNPEKEGVIMRVVLSKSYKLSAQDALGICEDTKSANDKTTRELFIARPLNELISKRLGHILRLRTSSGMSWAAAEETHNRVQFGGIDDSVMSDLGANDKGDAEKQNHPEILPTIVEADHLADTSGPYSFPLLAMQFLLRHLVHCTKFCLICHSHIDVNFEALKPYVCDSALCLYQYMSLGFGPSIEHEILNNTQVVDLLISFCFSASTSHRLGSFPVGMGLKVSRSFCSRPPEHGNTSGRPLVNTHPTRRSKKALPPTPDSLPRDALLDEIASTLKLGNQERDHRLLPGQWVEIKKGFDKIQHRCVREVFWPEISLGPPIIEAKTEVRDYTGGVVDGRQTLPASNATPSDGRTDSSTDLGHTQKATEMNTQKNIHNVQYTLWDCNFDDLDDLQQRNVITHLLLLLPSMTELVKYLEGTVEIARELQKWQDRIPPAVFGVLRWIIASNRSCIVQTEPVHPEGPMLEEKVSGMGHYVQFRFASGAPDKEQRFIEALEVKKNEKGLKHPSIFAWHGSPLGNWHGIVRDGLNYERTLHGRSFGDGVYHSLHLSTSLAYSGPDPGMHWPGSQLGVGTAVCLNEIVNVPSEFQSQNPHLVVQYIDWIQTRYLFVYCSKRQPPTVPEPAAKSKPKAQLTQDNVMRPKDQRGVAVAIPVTAISKTRRPCWNPTTPSKRVKLAVESEKSFPSDESDEEDKALMQEKVLTFSDPNLTKFEPSQLDRQTLTLLSTPSYATTNANKALQKELKRTLASQETQPLCELGWYVDGATVDNLYQWIFELHSFDKKLPLAMDMESRKTQSIVLELRFGKDFPFSPPFVRVIRPRFLPFSQGGGGHVTLGGALCMELLTNTGWNPASSMDAILLQVRMALTNLEPRPARLIDGPDYLAGEAMEAYSRVCRTHGWEIPDDFKQIATQ